MALFRGSDTEDPRRWKFKTPSGFQDSRRRAVRYLFCLEMPYLANPGRTRQSLGRLKCGTLLLVKR